MFDKPVERHGSAITPDAQFAGLKVAIVHYWLVGMRGGEKVVEDLCELFPQADIFTHVADPAKLSARLRRHKITETFIGRLPGAKRHYQKYLPLMPRALEALDLSGYDLVISSESGPAKGVVTDPDCLHLCFCHSPMRYIWDQYHVYRAQAGLVSRLAMSVLAPGLRVWDSASAARVDHVIANSDFVRRRVAKAWGRAADVVHPPVDLEAFTPGKPEDVGDFYLYVGELVSYKRPDLMIDSFNQTGKPLIVIGDGSERATLERRAKGNVRFLGRADFETLRDHYRRCCALVFPGVEDFGIIPLEAMASGRPVVAFARGGALETVRDGQTGVFFDTATPEALTEAIDRLESNLLPRLNSEVLSQHVARFGRERFRADMANHIASQLRAFRAVRT